MVTIRERLARLVEIGNRFRGTPIVDDDFPRVRDEFDRELRSATEHAAKPAPKVVCLCGSTRAAREAFPEWYGRLTDEGVIVLSVGRLQPVHGWDEEQKAALDELHKRKIDLCDEVLVLNVGGYIGDSTRSEIEYAARVGRPVKYLEDLTKE